VEIIVLLPVWPFDQITVPVQFEAVRVDVPVPQIVVVLAVIVGGSGFGLIDISCVSLYLL
jgi:hypothetical protein